MGVDQFYLYLDLERRKGSLDRLTYVIDTSTAIGMAVSGDKKVFSKYKKSLGV